MRAGEFKAGLSLNESRFCNRNNVMCCPICFKVLIVAKTRPRTVQVIKNDYETVKIVIRVLKCKTCGTTHTEIPVGVIPYKIWSVEIYCYYYAIAQKLKKEDLKLCDPALYKACRWKEGFDRLEADLVAGGVIVPEYQDLQEKTEWLIKTAINNNFWSHDYLADRRRS